MKNKYTGNLALDLRIKNRTNKIQQLKTQIENIENLAKKSNSPQYKETLMARANSLKGEKSMLENKNRNMSW